MKVKKTKQPISTAIGDATNVVVLLSAVTYLAALVGQEKGWINMF